MVFRLVRCFGVFGVLAAIGITLLCVLPKQPHVENDLTTPPPTPDGNIRGPSSNVVDVPTDLPTPPRPEARVGSTTTGTGGGSVPTTGASARVDGRGGNTSSVGGSVSTTAGSGRVDGRSGNEGGARTASGTNNVRAGGTAITTGTTGTSTTTTTTTTTAGSSDGSRRTTETPAAKGKPNNGSGVEGSDGSRTGQTSTRGEGADCIGPKCSGSQSEPGGTSRPEGDGGSASSPEANSGSSSATVENRRDDDGTQSTTGGKSTPVKQPVRGAPSTDARRSETGIPSGTGADGRNPHASEDQIPSEKTPESGSPSTPDVQPTTSVQQPVSGKGQGDGVTTVLSPPTPSDTQLGVSVESDNAVVTPSPAGPGVSPGGVTEPKVELPEHADQISDTAERQSDIPSYQPESTGDTSGQQGRSDASPPQQPDVNIKSQVDPAPVIQSTNTVPPKPSTGSSQPSTQDAPSSSTTVTRSSEPTSGPRVSSDGSHKAKVGSDESPPGQQNIGHNLHSGSSVSTESSQTAQVTNGSSTLTTIVQSTEDSSSRGGDVSSGERGETSDALNSRDNSRSPTPALPAASQEGSSDTRTASGNNDSPVSSNPVEGRSSEENSGRTPSPPVTPSPPPSQSGEGAQKVDAGASTDQDPKAGTQTPQVTAESPSSPVGEPSASVDGRVTSSAEVSSVPGSTVVQGGSEGMTSQGTGSVGTTGEQVRTGNQAHSHEGGVNSVDDQSNQAEDPQKPLNGSEPPKAPAALNQVESGEDNQLITGGSPQSTAITQGISYGDEPRHGTGGTHIDQTSQQHQEGHENGDTTSAVSPGNTETQNPSKQANLTTSLGNQNGDIVVNSPETSEGQDSSTSGKTVDGSNTGENTLNQPTVEQGTSTTLDNKNVGREGVSEQTRELRGKSTDTKVTESSGTDVSKVADQHGSNGLDNQNDKATSRSQDVPEQRDQGTVGETGQTVTGGGTSPALPSSDTRGVSTDPESKGVTAKGHISEEGQEASVSGVGGTVSLPSPPSIGPSDVSSNDDHQETSEDSTSLEDNGDNVKGKTPDQGTQSTDSQGGKDTEEDSVEQSDLNTRQSTDSGVGVTNEVSPVTQGSSSDSQGRVSGDSSSSTQQSHPEVSQSHGIDGIGGKSLEDQESGGPNVDVPTGDTVRGVGVTDNIKVGQTSDSGSTGTGGTYTGSGDTDTETAKETNPSSGKEERTAQKQEENQNIQSPVVGEQPRAETAEQKQQNDESSSDAIQTQDTSLSTDQEPPSTGDGSTKEIGTPSPVPAQSAEAAEQRQEDAESKSQHLSEQAMNTESSSLHGKLQEEGDHSPRTGDTKDSSDQDPPQTGDNGKSREITDSISPPNHISENGTSDSRGESEDSDSASKHEDEEDEDDGPLLTFPPRKYCPLGSC